jgi:hypothetical protein
MMLKRFICGLVGAFLVPGIVWAQASDGPACDDNKTRLEDSRYLRALSLDLRGKLPSVEDYAKMSDDGLETVLDAYLDSDEFGDRVVRHHRAMLWNNLAGTPVLSSGTRLVAGEGGVLYRPSISRTYRGSEVGCLNEPVRRKADGTIDWLDGSRTYMVDRMRITDATRQEGYVEVEPYWAPGTTVKICAWDAQAAMVSPSGTRCNTNAAHTDAACGCGAGLRWCATGAVDKTIGDALVSDVDRRIKTVVLSDTASYSELFTSRRAFVNGPLVHFYRHLTGFPGDVSFEPVAFDVARLPNLPANAVDSWREIEVPEYHAGVLTSPAYLLRFQTNRARADRLFDAFLCSPLQPPPGGLVFNQTRPNPDLQRRDGCKYCHANLEPTAAYWGRWAELGAGYLDATTFPARRTDCDACARTGEQCSEDCRKYYLLSALSVEEEPFLGMLKAYQFRADAHFPHVEQGPRLLVLSSIVDSRFSECASRGIAQRLMGREVTLGEKAWLLGMAQGFVDSGYKYKQLVKQIVSSDVYRRVR